MKFDELRFVAASTVSLPLEGVSHLTPFLLKAADGLGPTEVDVSIVRTRQMGGTYQGRQPQLREIVARIGLQPEWNVGQTPEDLRTIMYELLVPPFGRFVRAQVVSEDDVIGEVTGHVKKIEVGLFSQDPEVQVTFSCMSAYFHAPAEVTLTPTKVVDGSAAYFDVVNRGSAPSGFATKFTLSLAVSGSLDIMDSDPSGERLSINGPFAAGDTIIVDTRYGSPRGVWKIPSGSATATPILNQVDRTSTWLQLHQGTNRIYINTPNYNLTTYGVVHTPAYLGV